MPHSIGRRSLLAAAPLALAGHKAFANPQPLGSRFAALYKAASKEGRVVHYTSAQVDEVHALSVLWASNFPAIQLDVVSKPAPALISEIEAEKLAGRTFVDVATITEPYVAMQWQAKGLFKPYKVAAFGQLGDYAEPDGSYYVTGVYLLPPAFNTNAYPDKKSLPKNLAGFLDPAWKDKLVLADPKTAGGPLEVLMGMLQLGKIDWNWIEGLAKQNVLLVSANPAAIRIVAQVNGRFPPPFQRLISSPRSGTTSRSIFSPWPKGRRSPKGHRLSSPRRRTRTVRSFSSKC